MPPAARNGTGACALLMGSKDSPVNAEPSHRHLRGREKPLFCVRSKYFPSRYYVIARWRDGREFKITKFREKQSALDWIEDCSELWLERSV